MYKWGSFVIVQKKLTFHDWHSYLLSKFWLASRVPFTGTKGPNSNHEKQPQNIISQLAPCSRAGCVFLASTKPRFVRRTARQCRVIHHSRERVSTAPESNDDATLKVTELFSKTILMPMFVYGDCMALCTIFIHLSATGVVEIATSTNLKGCPHTFVYIVYDDHKVCGNSSRAFPLDVWDVWEN